MLIDTMPAGRELDALVAEKVMGWYRVGTMWCQGANSYAAPAEDLEIENPPKTKPWSPSTDIAAAWEVVEKIKAVDLRSKTGIDFPDECMTVAWDRSTKEWAAGFHAIDGYDAGWVAGTRATADTAPLAICRAALVSVSK